VAAEVAEPAETVAAEVAAPVETVAAEVAEPVETAAAEVAEPAETVAAEVTEPAETVAAEEFRAADILGEEIESAEESRLRARAALDKSLEQAARQMAELEASAPSATQERADDNLAGITGIGPVFRVRLRQAGITNFAQLAAATPEALAAITEQSVERIERDDWIGQAAEKVAVG
jgi:predicted flap endonuclease-1-like 5' DNA nuclease